MKKKIFFGLMSLTFLSCSHKVYLYDLKVSGDPKKVYIIQDKKNKFEIYYPQTLNLVYVQSMNDSTALKEVKSRGHTMRSDERSYSFKVERNDSGFIYTYPKDPFLHPNWDSTEVDFQPLFQTDSCFVSSTFIWDNLGYQGNANKISDRQWSEFYTRVISTNTLYYFNSQLPREAVLVEYAPFYPKLRNDSCLYIDPIEAYIDKETGLPLSIHYLNYVINQQYDIWISCDDYKKIRMRRKRLNKILFR